MFWTTALSGITNWRSGEPGWSSYDYLTIRTTGWWEMDFLIPDHSVQRHTAYTARLEFRLRQGQGPRRQHDRPREHLRALALAAAWVQYRHKKIKRSRGLKREIKRMNSELTYKNAAVGMRVAVTAAGRRPAVPLRALTPGVLLEESPARLELHPIEEPHWIPYDAATTSLLEKN